MNVRQPSLDELAAEREFLLTSLRDLDTELAAGDVSDEDYESLRASYTERAARTLRAIEELGSAPAEISRRGGLRRALGRRRTRRWLAISGTACLAIGVTFTAASLAGVRLPGESATGSVTIPTVERVSEDLVAAQGYANEGEIPAAISLYAAVLALEPRQPEALTYSGWLERLAGLRGHSARTVAVGDAAMRRATRVAPGYADARALYGVALADDDHDPAAATTEFRAFLAEDKSPDYHRLLVDLGGEMAGVFRAAHEPVPRPLLGLHASTAKSR